MSERQPVHYGVETGTEGMDRVKRLPPLAKRYLRLSAIAQLRTLPEQTRMRARTRALDIFGQMDDGETEQLVGFLSWRQDNVIRKMTNELEKGRLPRAKTSTP